MKRILMFLVVAFIAPAIVHAQNRNIYYLKNSGEEVRESDSADYIRIIQEPDSGSLYFPITEIYANKQRKLIGHVSSFEPSLVYEGPTLSYYENGKKKQQITYNRGMPTGLAYYFHINGKLSKIVEYGDDGVENFLGFGMVAKGKVVSVLDSSGIVMVRDGNGTAHQISEEEQLRETGMYVNGLKHGRWSGADLQGNFTFEEIYESGKLIQGTSALPSGKRYEYKQLQKLPEFKGGADAFNRFLTQTIRYPSDARADGITGRVFLQYVIAADGSVRDVEVVAPVHPSLDREAVSVLRRSPKWLPATKRGIPVSATYRMPVTFQLGGQFFPKK